MMTESREHLVEVALNDLLPDSYTWEERRDPEWLRAFPAGVAPLFAHGRTVSVCTARIVEVGANLEPYDFDSLLDALFVWVTESMVDLQSGVPRATVLERFAEREPVETMVLTAAATHRGLSLFEFVGLGAP